MIKQRSRGLDNRFSTAFTFQLSLFFFHSWETCPKSRQATLRAEKALKDLEDEGLAPDLFKGTTGEKQGLFVRTDGEKYFVLGGHSGCCFIFCLSSVFTDLKKCWVFPGSPPSSSSFLQYSWIFCAALPFHFAGGCHVQGNWNLLRCNPWTCWALILALHALSEKILSLRNLYNRWKDTNRCKLAFLDHRHSELHWTFPRIITSTRPGDSWQYGP